MRGQRNANHAWSSYTYNPASQLTYRWSNTDAYAFNGYVNVNRPYATNGLNQYTSAGPASFAYDANGNLTSDSATTFTYDVENRLVAARGARNVGEFRGGSCGDTGVAGTRYQLAIATAETDYAMPRSITQPGADPRQERRIDDAKGI